MASKTRKLVLVAVLASTLPAAALARDCDHDRPLPAPPVSPAHVYVPASRTPPPAPEWREGRSRRHELRELRAEFRELERTRADFYARWGSHHRKVAKFERWYGQRHAELERRWYALQRYASR
jgi:hypothetical protein